MYLDVYHDKNGNKIRSVERGADGVRVFKDVNPEWSFYYTDPDGDHKSIYGEKLSFFNGKKADFWTEKKKHIAEGRSVYESDVTPLFKMMESEYKGADTPKMNITYFDIEVDWSPTRGFAPPDNPFNTITAISLYNSWEEKCYTLVMAPPTITEEEAKKICDSYENTILCPNEAMILKIFLELIRDSDVLTGWNSDSYDIPYIVGRLNMLPKENNVALATKLCHWGVMPQKKLFEKFGKETLTYSLVGRLHLDYLELYRKFTFSELHSYALDVVGDHEVNERKVAYDGSLDDLYKKDFNKFVDYSRQDVFLLKKIDDKLKFIELVNTMAHENCIPLPKTLGAVHLSDHAIILEIHDRGFVVNDRVKKMDEDDIQDAYDPIDDGHDEPVAVKKGRKKLPTHREAAAIISTKIAGAYVADPIKGLSKWLGSVDITSLYPSVIMALNISPETIFGQIHQDDTKAYLIKHLMENGDDSFADAWAGRFASIEFDRMYAGGKDKVDVSFEAAKKIIQTTTMTADELREIIYESDNTLCISANGTIFNFEKEGMIPGLIARWFKERIEMQGEKAKYKKAIEEETDEAKLIDLRMQLLFWDQRQHIKKIQLNSLYGALTNAGSRFYDSRMGQSITLSGRMIAKHMGGSINEILTGTFDHRGPCITYGDTDSVYFSAWPMKDEMEGFEFNEDNVVALYDQVAVSVNETFPAFMVRAFNAEPTRAKRIKANREICAKTALFVKKKRYAAIVYDNEGQKTNKLKIMGMDTQRADTPKFVQKFLKEILRMTLEEKSEEDILDHVRDFRMNFRKLKPWEMGIPRRCNKLTFYSNIEDASPNSRLPGHVRGAYNWNKTKTVMDDKVSMDVLDGGKVIVCDLKKNNLNIKNIAYPIDENNLPSWFYDLQFDAKKMEEKLIDKKLDNIVGLMGYKIASTKIKKIDNSMFVMR